MLETRQFKKTSVKFTRLTEKEALPQIVSLITRLNTVDHSSRATTVTPCHDNNSTRLNTSFNSTRATTVNYTRNTTAYHDRPSTKQHSLFHHSSPTLSSSLIQLQGIYPLLDNQIPHTADVSPIIHPFTINPKSKRIVFKKPSTNQSTTSISYKSSREPGHQRIRNVSIDNETQEYIKQPDYIPISRGKVLALPETLNYFSNRVKDLIVPEYVLEILESTCKKYRLKWIEIDIKKLIDYFTRPLFNGNLDHLEFLNMTINNEAKLQIEKREIFVGHFKLAASVVSDTFSTFHLRQKHLAIVSLLKAARVFTFYWKKRKFRRCLSNRIQVSNKKHYEKAILLEQRFRDSFERRSMNKNKVVIHLPSLPSPSNGPQKMQLGRILDLYDKHTTVIYISSTLDSESVQHFNHMIKSSFEDDDSWKRLHVIVPKTASHFPDTASIASILASCDESLKKIKEIVANTRCFIVPCVMGPDDYRISSVFSNNLDSWDPFIRSNSSRQ